MKQKLLSMLTLLLVCCCHLQIRAAEIVAPVEPEWTETAVAPVSGHVYYIKCVDDGAYLQNPVPNYDIRTSANIENAGGYVFSKSSSGWSMMSAANADYLKANIGSLSHANTLDANCYWKFDDESSADGHLIMKAEGQSNYSETNKYWYTSSSSIYVNGSSNSAKRFVFIDADVRERYLASKKLYDAILVAKNRKLYVPKYEAFYNDRGNHTVAEIYAEANELIAATTTTKEKIILSDNEYPFILTATQGNWNNWNDQLGIEPKEGETVSLKASFYVDKPSTFVYTLDMSTQETYIEKVYVDGQLVRTVYNSYDINGNHYEELGAGEHTIEWLFTKTNRNAYYYLYFKNLALMSSPLITVNLLEPGSLGTEALRNVGGLKDVKALKVIGRMNDDDWRYLSMMNNLLTVDLSEAIFTEIPEKGMSRQNNKFGFLHKVVLPEGVTKIGERAFYQTHIEEVNIPSTVETIGNYAFYLTNIKDITLPNSVLTIGEYCFENCYRLKHASISNQIKEIPDYAFANCYQLSNNPLPEGITRIGYQAFWQCYSLCSANDGELVVPSKVTYIADQAFRDCDSVTSVELPTTLFDIENYKIGVVSSPIFDYCDNINKIILRSPTLVTHKNNVLGCDLSKVDLIVPDYLVSNYKLDDYWYNYKTISGFSTADIQDWTINNPLVLNHDRFAGTPIIRINGNKDRKPSLKLNGDGAMTISDLYFNTDYYDYGYTNYPGQILSNCNDITINGDVQVELYTKAKNWYFFSLPFDIKVSEITHSEDGVQKAVRYYDGAGRATSGAGGNWKEYEADAVITAGTGFIIQTNADTYNYFHSLDNANKQLCVSNAEIVKSLEVNDSEVASNKGWNLVGNPWQCYYNDHNLNFTAPFTVWNVKDHTYAAYSITDDDYAIRPNEAFFVQCPNAEFNTIGFPIGGRQLTDVIETQNAAKPMKNAAAQRLLVNVKISNGENEDQTRVVLNEKASMDYEVHCDASKMMSMDESVAQIYTLDADGTQYAINERPMDTGIVSLGIYAGTEGVYTLSLGRCDAETVVLIDYETGTEQSLTGDYTFTARAGYDNGRFALRFNAGETTGITSVNSNYTLDNAPCYNLSGQRVERGAKGIQIVGGRKIVNK